MYNPRCIKLPGLPVDVRLSPSYMLLSLQRELRIPEDDTSDTKERGKEHILRIVSQLVSGILTEKPKSGVGIRKQ